MEGGGRECLREVVIVDLLGKMIFLQPGNRSAPSTSSCYNGQDDKHTPLARAHPPSSAHPNRHSLSPVPRRAARSPITPSHSPTSSSHHSPCCLQHHRLLSLAEPSSPREAALPADPSADCLPVDGQKDTHTKPEEAHASCQCR